MPETSQPDLWIAVEPYRGSDTSMVWVFDTPVPVEQGLWAKSCIYWSICEGERDSMLYLSGMATTETLLSRDGQLSSPEIVAIYLALAEGYQRLAQD